MLYNIVIYIYIHAYIHTTYNSAVYYVILIMLYESTFCKGGVQWKQGVVFCTVLPTSLLYNTTPIHCTPHPLHPPSFRVSNGGFKPNSKPFQVSNQGGLNQTRKPFGFQTREFKPNPKPFRVSNERVQIKPETLSAECPMRRSSGRCRPWPRAPSPGRGS